MQASNSSLFCDDTGPPTTTTRCFVAGSTIQHEHVSRCRLRIPFRLSTSVRCLRGANPQKRNFKSYNLLLGLSRMTSGTHPCLCFIVPLSSFFFRNEVFCQAQAKERREKREEEMRSVSKHCADLHQEASGSFEHKSVLLCAGLIHAALPYILTDPGGATPSSRNRSLRTC